jgi:hypothetical protein
MSKWKKITLAVLAIILAIATALYAFLDDDPGTNPDVTGTIETVTENIDVIKNEMNDGDKASTAPVSPEVPGVPSE